MSLLLVSTTYPAKLDADGDPHEVFEDDTRYSSMATIAFASELGRRQELLDRFAADNRSAKERRMAARRAEGKGELDGVALPRWRHRRCGSPCGNVTIRGGTSTALHYERQLPDPDSAPTA